VSVTVICPWWVATEFHAAQPTKDNTPRGMSRGRNFYTSKTMSAASCAEITLKAAHKRRREVLMGHSFCSVLLKALAPGFVDWLVIKVFLEQAICRARASQSEKAQ